MLVHKSVRSDAPDWQCGMKGYRQVNELTSQSLTGSAGQKPAARPATSAQVVRAWARALR